LKISAIGLGVLSAIPIATIAISFSGTSPIVDGKELSAGATQVKDAIVSAAVIPAGVHAVVLVDCGNDHTATPILAELKRRGLQADDVKALFLTHGHSDHVSGCAQFPKAEVFAMQQEVDLLEGRAASRAPIGKLMGKKDSGVRVTHPLHDGEAIRVGALQGTAYSIPGHTDGSAAYVFDGVVYLGDSADSTKDGKVAPAKWIFSNDRAQNRASLQRLAQILEPRKTEIRWLEFAHSGPLPGLDPLTEFARTP
jgi:glyoxylase-like metal-dependent hydrolase (beta-lactamase superfamily II)